LYRCETDPQWAYDRIQQLRHKLASAMLAAEAVAASMEHVLNELTEEVAS
jgi:hypothetical protein